MIARYVYTALQNELNAIKQDPGILDDIFGAVYVLGSPEIVAIKQFFATQLAAGTLQIFQAYAREASTMPMYGIVMQSETQSESFLNDSGGLVDDVALGDPDYGDPQNGAIFESVYQILCYAENVDVVTYMYEVAKAAMFTNSSYFIQQGVENMLISGMDLMPDPRYLPEHLFCRALQFRCKHEFVVIQRDTGLVRGTKIDGLFLPPGSPQSNGGATTLVTVTEPNTAPRS